MSLKELSESSQTEVSQVSDPGPARGDELDGDRLGGGVAREGLPVRHRVLVASGHVDHQLGGVRVQGEEKNHQQDDHCHNKVEIISFIIWSGSTKRSQMPHSVVL